MLKKISLQILLLFMFLSPYIVGAQGENNHWNVGQGIHIDFNNNPASYDLNSSMRSHEANTSVSDAQGNLLFYTMGCRIWDRNGNEMPNATGLQGNGPLTGAGVGAGSSYDGVQVIPHPTNINQYYVFSGDAYENPAGKLYYHLVDLSLNNGLGDVVAGQKNLVLMNGGCSEFLTVAYGDCLSYWLIVVNQSGHNLAFKVDQNGVNHTPVVSIPPVITTNTFSFIRILNNDICFSKFGTGLLRSQFNRSTGVFSNFEQIPDLGINIFAFSEDNEKLYGAALDQIRQWDFSLYPNMSAVLASVTELVLPMTLTNFFTTMKLGADGKIYATRGTLLGPGVEFTIDRIDQPNVLGLGSSYNQNVFNNTNLSSFNSFGSDVLKRHQLDTIYSPKAILDTILCRPIPVNLQSPHNALVYEWSNGNNSSQISATDAGTYWVYAFTSDCKVYIDSFKIEHSNLALDLGNDTTFCEGKSVVLNAYHPDAQNYIWSNGSNNAQIEVITAGTYTVTMFDGHCNVSDTIVISKITPNTTLLPSDTFLCEGDAITITAHSNLQSDYTWNDGQVGKTIQIQQPGVYIVSAQNVCGTQLDSIVVDQVLCNCVPIIPNAFSPNGDGKNDAFVPKFNENCMLKYYELQIFNRYGQLVFSTNQKSYGWDGTYGDGRVADVGVYFYVLKFAGTLGNAKEKLMKGDITIFR